MCRNGRKVARDGALRWERRLLALERRLLIEVVGKEVSRDENDGEASVENWWVTRRFIDEKDENKESGEVSEG